MLVGILSTFVVLIVVGVEKQQWDQVIASCASSSCVFRQTVLVVFLWPFILVTLLFSSVFVIWLRGAFDLQGPFRRRMLAPGVWYEEKKVVELVRQCLQEDQLPLFDDNTIIRTARSLRESVGTYKDVPHARLKNGHLDPVFLANLYVNATSGHKYAAHPDKRKAARVMATTILTYYLDAYVRAVEKWPWRQKIWRY
jgi:hypothetical protein